jgi:fibronectin-binding autotransporter adhesin
MNCQISRYSLSVSKRHTHLPAIFRIFFLMLLLSLSADRGLTQTVYIWTGTTSNAWQVVTNWTPNGNPGSAANDAVIIPTTAVTPVLTITPDNPLDSLKFLLTTSAAKMLTITNVATLTVTGTVSMGSNALTNTAATLTGTGTLNCGSLDLGSGIGATGAARTTSLTATIANMVISGNLVLNSSFSTFRNNSFFFHTTGNITVNGSVITVNPNAGNTSSYLTGTGTSSLNLAGATPFVIDPVGTSTFLFTGTGSTVRYTNNASISFLAAPAGLLAYRNLNIEGGNDAVKTFTGGLTLTTLTVTAATTLDAGTSVFTPTTVTMQNQGGLNGSVITGTGQMRLAGNVTVNYTGSGAVASPSAIGVPIMVVTATRTFAVTDDGTDAVDLSLPSTISSNGAFGITKTVAGKLEISGLNTYTGLTTVTLGVLKLGAAGNATNTPLGTTDSYTLISPATGAALDLAGFTLGTNELIAIRGTGISSTGSLLNSSATAVTISGVLSLTNTAAVDADFGEIHFTNPNAVMLGPYALTLDGATGGTISGAITSTTGGITKSGTGTWTLSGLNTYNGLTTINAGGILRLGAAGDATNSPLGSTTGAVSVIAGGALDLAGYTLQAAESVTIRGTGITSQGALMNSSSTAVDFPGQVVIGTAAASIVAETAAINLTHANLTGSNAGFVLGGSAGGIITSNIAVGTGTITKNGTGTWTLSGLNTYTGLTTINTGILKLGSAGDATNSPLGTSAGGVSVIAGAALDLAGYSLQTTDAVTIRGTGITSLGALMNSSSTAVDYPGQVILGSTGASIVGETAAINLVNSLTSITGNTFGIILGGAIGGRIERTIATTSGTVTIEGGGSWILSGASTYTGATNITDGVLRLGAAGTGANTPLGTITGATVISANGSLDLNGFTLTTSEPLTISGSGKVTGTGAMMNNSSTTATYNGLLTLAADAAIKGGSGLIAVNNTGTITGSGFILTLGGAAGGSISSTIGTAAGSVIKEDAGAWTVMRSNTFTGGVTLNDGTLRIGHVQALGTVAGIFTINGGTIDNSTTGSLTTLNYPKTFNGDFSFAGSNALNLGTGAVTIGTSLQVTTTALTLTIGGTFSTTFNLTKAGAGILHLGASAIEMNNLTISAGTLVSTSETMHIGGTLSSSGTFTHNNGTVNFNAAGPQTIPPLSFNNLHLSNAGVKTISPATTVNCVTLTINDSATLAIPDTAGINIG